MPALKPTDYTGRIVWLGLVADRNAALRSTPVPGLEARFSGPEGDAHAGLTRASCSRVLTQHPRGTTIRNVRQFSVISFEDLADITARMKIDVLDPSLLGATLVLEGLPDLTHLPPSSRLQAASGATLVVDMENRACQLPAVPIEAAFPGKGKAFKSAAQGRRGVTAWVEREGWLALGDVMRLHIPNQPIWQPTQGRLAL